jgi:hypothetical protein
VHGARTTRTGEQQVRGYFRLILRLQAQNASWASETTKRGELDVGFGSAVRMTAGDRKGEVSSSRGALIGTVRRTEQYQGPGEYGSDVGVGQDVEGMSR